MIVRRSSRTTVWVLLAELMFHCRPLVYLLALLADSQEQQLPQQQPQPQQQDQQQQIGTAVQAEIRHGEHRPNNTEGQAEASYGQEGHADVVQRRALALTTKRRWSIWTFVCLLDVLALLMLTSNARLSPARSPAGALERAEIRRRFGNLFWALARPPFFEATLERPLKAVDRCVRKIPVLNAFNVLEIFLAFRRYYFYTSAS